MAPCPASAQRLHDRRTAGSFDGRGLSLDAAHIDGLRRTAPRRFDSPVLRRANFERATFVDDVAFSNFIFDAGVSFRDATFEGNVSFAGATFRPGFEAQFDGTRFAGQAYFASARFLGPASFRSSFFNGSVVLDHALFAHALILDAATFDAEASLGSLQVLSNASFIDTSFKSRDLGPFLIRGLGKFDGALFSEQVNLRMVAFGGSFCGSRFEQGGTLSFRWTAIAFDDATFENPMRISSAAPFNEFDEREFMRYRPEGTPDLHETPRLISVRHTSLANVTLANLDIAACLFEGARDVDRLRLEGDVRFAQAPSEWILDRHGLRRSSTPRRTIAEEHELRASSDSSQPLNRRDQARARSWSSSSVARPEWYDVVHPVAASRPQEVAATYRALRKGLEDSKDSAGAADFYYGEMEARRMAATALSAEKFVLSAYWLFSGYGLRASRALIGLGITILGFAFFIRAWGLEGSDDASFGEALLFSAKSTTSLFRAPEETLTIFGQVLEMVLRLIGPLFFGLAVFSLRGYVRR